MELTRSIPQGDQGPGYGSWEINTALQQEIEGNYSNGSPVAINPANTRSMISTPSQWQSDGITRGEVESHSLYGDGLYRRGEDRPVVVTLTPPMEPAMGPLPSLMRIGSPIPLATGITICLPSIWTLSALATKSRWSISSWPPRVRS